MKEFTRIEPTDEYQVGGKFKKTVVVKHFHTADGKVHEFTTFHKENIHAGAVIAVTPDAKVAVSYQFRPGPERWMYEIPGGMFGRDEDFQAAALRELQEETGYVSDEVELLGTSCRDAYVNATWHYYLAKNCYPAKNGQTLDEEESDQGLEVRLITIDELIYNATHDLMTDPAAVLMAYEKLKEIQHATNRST